MAFYSFKVNENLYELRDVTNSINHDHSLSDDAYYFTLLRENKDNEDIFVARIAGDICWDDSLGEKSPYLFVCIDSQLSTNADKIAVYRALYFLNNEEYRKS